MRIIPHSSIYLLAVLACSAAWSAEPPTPAQEQELQNALTEGIATKDFKLLDLSLKGFAAGAVQGENVKKHIADARVDAAMAMLAPFHAGAIEAWTLAAQAKSGDSSALESLRTAARTTFDTTKRPATKEEARALQIRQQTGLAALECLANLNDDSVPAIIRSWMAVTPAAMPDFNLMQTDPVAYAFATGNCYATRAIPQQVLTAEKTLSGDAWPGKVQALISDRAFTLATRAELLMYAAGQARTDDKIAPDAAKAFDALFFSLVDDIDGKTPSNTIQQFLLNSLRIGDYDQKLAYLKRVEERVTDANIKKMVAAYAKSAATMHNNNAGADAKRSQPSAPVVPPKENGGEF
ncbi:MAG: hypothetical protein L6R28_23565 [Planctomycetes bacterium]|nr:hypothetical protein [Planctomycetota bacterium]